MCNSSLFLWSLLHRRMYHTASLHKTNLLLIIELQAPADTLAPLPPTDVATSSTSSEWITILSAVLIVFCLLFCGFCYCMKKFRGIGSPCPLCRNTWHGSHTTECHQVPNWQPKIFDYLMWLGICSAFLYKFFAVKPSFIKKWINYFIPIPSFLFPNCSDCFVLIIVWFTV